MWQKKRDEEFPKHPPTVDEKGGVAELFLAQAPPPTKKKRQEDD